MKKEKQPKPPKEPKPPKPRKPAKKAEAFAVYLEGLPETDAVKLRRYFSDFSQHCVLNRNGTELLRRDFERALLYYASASVPLDTALERLNLVHLGGFYVRPPILWYSLDNAAKIYPLSMKANQMAVFRLSMYLTEPIVPELLQMALNFTIKRFPNFATTVKKGYFWHFLDSAKHRYEAHAETGIPCQPLHISASTAQCFRVLWYENRISVEFFHILTDGTGGVCFLKALCAEYLRLCGVQSSEEGLLGRDDTPTAQEAVNEFIRAESVEKGGGFMDAAATQMSGRLSNVKPCQVLHFRMDTERLKQEAKARDVTITVYILSKLFLAGRAATDDLQGTISIQVPVNMRKFYPSDTLRNFSLYCGIRLPIDTIVDGDAMRAEITAQLAQKGSREAMDVMMRSTCNLVNGLRYIPLKVKTPAARVIYGFLGDGIFSNTLSNLGVVTMPPGYAAHIQNMDFVLGTAITNRAACSMVTFGNTTTLSIAKQTIDPSFEEALYGLLAADGVTPEVEGSPLYEY